MYESLKRRLKRLEQRAGVGQEKRKLEIITVEGETPEELEAKIKELNPAAPNTDRLIIEKVIIVPTMFMPRPGQAEPEQLRERPGREIQASLEANSARRTGDPPLPGQGVAGDDRAAKLRAEIAELKARKKKLLAARRNIEKRNSEEGQRAQPMSVTFPKIKIGGVKKK